MVRRVDTSDEDAPQKNAKLKADKVKMEKGKGKARVQDEDEMEEGSPKGAKRARANDAGDAVRHDDDEEDGDGEPDDDATPPPARVKTLPRDVDGFIPGSIVRIQLRNFVTYDAVEFRPGAFLNMILGPNGTGKSSIACAICLGLNWPPSILGRAADLNSFVKINADTGHIEIELKAPAGEPNLVIRRNLNAKSKSSSFMLNGVSATGREINERVARLNVQVGNLCSFLPQDKVSEFAAMSPRELLRETQRAAGDERLTSWHDVLIGAGKELKDVTEAIKMETASVRQLRERNEGIENDVQRYRDRKRIEHAIAMLNVLIPIQHYREARRDYLAMKVRQRAQHLRVSRLQEKNRPAHALLAKLENQHQELMEDRDAAKKLTRVAMDKIAKRVKESERLETESEDLQNALANLKKLEKQRERTIKNCEAQIVKFQEDMQREVEVEVEADVKAERQRAQSAWTAGNVEAERRALNDKHNELLRRKDRNARDEQAAKRELADLDSADTVKLNNLGRWDRDVADAVRWLRANKERFRMQVFEPPIISASVPNPAFAAAVESCFNQNTLKMFVCQCKEDYDLLNNSINDNPGLGRGAHVPTWFRPGTERDLMPPPLSRDEMKALGFDGYALEYIDCPEGLKWYFQRELNMHRTAISRKGVTDLRRAIDMVGRPLPNGRSANANFVDQSTLHQVQRSRYGKREVMASTQNVNPARNFGGKTQVDPADKRRIDENLAKCKQEAAMVEEEEREMNAENQRLKVLETEHTARMGKFAVRLKAISDEVARQVKLKRLLEKAQNELASAQKKGNAVQEGARIRGQILAIAKKRVKLVKDAVEVSHAVITEQTKGTRLALQYLQVGAKKVALKELCDKKDERYNVALAEFNKIDSEFKKLKDKSRTLLGESKELLNDLPDDLREEYQEMETERLAHEQGVEKAEQDGTTPPAPSDKVDLRSLDELQAELELQQANLDMNMNTNPGVVEQYEKRKRDIEMLEKTIENRQRQADKIERNIKNARDNWEPALQSLVTSIGKKFSAAFDRIGCAGEIRVRQEEAYENWAIDILVKFRDTEKLQLLTGQRQSGGERSLTTILYLMSLTEEARAPFSLVDEINQGMDQRAERMVHNSMVEVTCKADSAQYFLITPKLLPDLEYHERMKVLCVNNGEWLPEESGLGNMMSMIEGYVVKQKQKQ
ncbi:hypothetical protein B0H10DRAFT_2229461 [Mycena sp. CBHHK59/15]|nr:hypothetical protein B0H10DRAFT_2229461 [Mycena sp. CBHHK59/15]